MAGNPIWSLIWFILLIAISWPVAFFCAVIWVTLQPFEACFGCAKDCSDTFEQYTTWPRDVGNAIAKCQSGCPKP